VERSQALTLQYDKVVFILEPSEQAKAAIGKGVTVVDDPDGRSHGHVRRQGSGLGVHGQFSGRCFGSKV